MPTLAELDLIFENKAARLFPGTAAQAAFKPHFDLAAGDVGSEICQQLADQLRQPVSGIAGKLIAALQSELPLKISLFESYLNVRFPDELKWLACAEPLQIAQARVSVYLPPAATFPSQFAYARAACSAALQTLIWQDLGAAVRLVAGDKEISQSECSGPTRAKGRSPARLPFHQLVRAVLSAAISEGAHNRFTDVTALDGQLRAQADEEAFIWASSELAWSDPFRPLSQKLHRCCRRAAVKTFDKSWYDTPPEEFDLARIVALDAEALGALALSLSGPQPSSDVDLEIPLRKGHASILHFLLASRERYDKFMADLPGLAAGVSADMTVSSVLLRELLLRVRFLKSLHRIAAANGRISELISAWHQLLAGLNRLLNERNFRERCGSGAALNAAETQILTGVGPLLSDMVKMFAV